MKALSPGRLPLPTPQLPFLLLWAAFSMAPGGQTAQEGPPGAQAGVGPTPNCFEPARRGRTAGWPPATGGPRAARRFPALPLGMAARGQTWGTRGGHKASADLEKGVSESFGGEQTRSGSSTVSGSQWVHHPFLENNRSGEDGGSTEAGVAKL